MMKFILLLTFVLLDLTTSYSVIGNERLATKPPRPTDHAKVARNLVQKAKWASVGTISTEKIIKGYPMVNIMSIVDGTKNGESTGVIYFLSTKLDFTGKDLMAVNETTFMLTNDADLSCTKNDIDPMEPTCARIIVSGSVTKVDKSLDEYKQGLDDMMKAHPAADKWLQAHAFALCKLNIKNIYVTDYYGPPRHVTPEEYYEAIPDKN